VLDVLSFFTADETDEEEKGKYMTLKKKRL
jgi:hypothetical protein